SIGPAKQTQPQLPIIRELEKGVYLVPNVRGGFHVLVKEFEDYLMVVDTPAGYHELQQIPALDWASEVSSDAVGHRLMAVLRRDFPQKPVKYVVLTHYHSDHTGGVLPFVRAGATIVASPETAAVVRATIGKTRRDLKIDTVRNERVISGNGSNVRVINIGQNPHVKGMLVVFLPRESILYQSDLFEPIGMRFFPSPGRVPAMKWFVEWLDRSRLQPRRIYSIHGSGTVTDEHLAKIRSMIQAEKEQFPDR
ncbi:MAG: MBL fold metallo-hydrolase, partial [Pyrinomonadaceae bacterium]